MFVGGGEGTNAHDLCAPRAYHLVAVAGVGTWVRRPKALPAPRAIC